jgi:hypothetical protein
MRRNIAAALPSGRAGYSFREVFALANGIFPVHGNTVDSGFANDIIAADQYSGNLDATAISVILPF